MSTMKIIQNSTHPKKVPISDLKVGQLVRDSFGGTFLIIQDNNHHLNAGISGITVFTLDLSDFSPYTFNGYNTVVPLDGTLSITAEVENK